MDSQQSPLDDDGSRSTYSTPFDEHPQLMYSGAQVSEGTTLQPSTLSNEDDGDESSSDEIRKRSYLPTSMKGNVFRQPESPRTPPKRTKPAGSNFSPPLLVAVIDAAAAKPDARLSFDDCDGDDLNDSFDDECNVGFDDEYNEQLGHDDQMIAIVGFEDEPAGHSFPVPVINRNRQGFAAEKESLYEEQNRQSSLAGHSAPALFVPTSSPNDEQIRALPSEEQRSSPTSDTASMLLMPRNKIWFANKEKLCASHPKEHRNIHPASHSASAPLTMNRNKQGFATAETELYVPSAKKSTTPNSQYKGFRLGLSDNTMYDGLSVSMTDGDTTADDGSLMTLSENGNELEEPIPSKNPKKRRRKKAAAIAACWEHVCCFSKDKRHRWLAVLSIVLAIIFAILLGAFLSTRDAPKSNSASFEAQQLDRTSSPSVVPQATIDNNDEPNLGNPQEDNIFVPAPTPNAPASDDPQETTTNPIAGDISPPTAPSIAPTPPPIAPTSSPIASIAPDETLPNIERTCGMQTPGVVIVDGGGLERDRGIATIEALLQELYVVGTTTNDDASLVMIPSAGSEIEDDELEEYEELWTQDVGLSSDQFTILHPERVDSGYTGVEDAAEADTEAFVEPIKDANAIFMRGGRQWRLVDAYKYTRTLDEMWNLLARGGVISGTSAGAAVQGYFMPRGDPSGSGMVIADREWHQYGFGFVPGVAFDVKVNAGDRWDDLYEVLSSHPDLLGIGISEYTAIVVQGKYFHVVGERGDDSRVAVYQCADRESCNEEDSPFDVLVPGQWFDLCTREIVDEPTQEELVVTKVYPMSLPYTFREDYRASGRVFSCSGRFCRWTSNVIKLPPASTEVSEVRLSARLISDGDLEDDTDFVRVLYRLGTDGQFGLWELARIKNGAFSAEFLNTVIPLGEQARDLQIRIESLTSKEEGETYVVEDLQVAEKK